MPTLRRRNPDTRQREQGAPFARRWPTPPGRSRTASSGALPTSSGDDASMAVRDGGRALEPAGPRRRPRRHDRPRRRRRRRGRRSSPTPPAASRRRPGIVRVSAPARSPTDPLGEGGRGDRRPGPAGIDPQLRRRAGRRRHQGRSRHRTAGAPRSPPTRRDRRRRAQPARPRPAAAPRWRARRRSRSRGSSPAPSSSTRPAATRPRSRPSSTRPPHPSSPRRCSSGRRGCRPTSKVPEAKVLNIVAGPKHGDVYTLSVSLLRVGVTSELRLDMQKTPAGKPATARTNRTRSAGS